MNLLKRNFKLCARFYSEERSDSPMQRRFLRTLKIISLSLKYLFLKKIEIPFVEDIVTTKCTLACKHCSNLIPSFRSVNIPDMSVENYLQGVKALTDKVDYIYRFKIHGGEPMTCNHLVEIIEECCANEKIGEVRMSTNCTILPDERTIKAFQNKKFVLFISNYACVGNNVERYVELCKKNNIRFRFDENQKWVTYGQVIKHNKTEQQLKRERNLCSMANCVAMKDNKIYLCSRIANAVKLGLIESDNGIDIYSPKFAREIGRMYGQKLNPLCDFCGVDVNSIVEAGEQ